MGTDELILALRNLAETSRFAHDEGILMMAADRLEELDERVSIMMGGVKDGKNDAE